MTVLGTTDLHGNVFNWDYYKNKEYDDTAHNDIGVAKVATLVKAMRKKFRKRGPVLLLDAGDTIQGTPLAYYYARIAPITTGGVHPMAAAMNKMHYDAAALGNHEFNYGIDTLRVFESQLEHPLLGANVVDPATKRPVFPPYVIKKYRIAPGRKLKIGILGLVTPGVAIWDKANVQGRIEFPGLVEQAAKYVPEMKKKGCDLVIVSAHSGADTSSSYGDALPYPENAASLVAEQVPDIDAILVGHAHKEIPQRFVTNTKTGKRVLLCEPLYWGMRLAVMNLTVEWQQRKRRWKLVRTHSQLLNSNTAKENGKVAKAVRAQHDKVVSYVNAPIGTSTKLLSAARSVVEDVPIIDFIQYVQAGAVKAALAGTPDANLPVLSEAAPFSRTASFPQGQVSVRDVAGLYIYDNTLLGVKITGADVKAYLEFSAAYFKQQNAPGPYTIAQLTNAVTPTAPNGIPDYNFDSIRGLDLPPHLPDRRGQGRRQPHPRPEVRRCADRPGGAVRAGDQQLPAVRRGRLPRGQDRPGGLQRPGRDPAAAHRLGHRPPRHRRGHPADEVPPGVEARLRRRGRSCQLTSWRSGRERRGPAAHLRRFVTRHGSPAGAARRTRASPRRRRRCGAGSSGRCARARAPARAGRAWRR